MSLDKEYEILAEKLLNDEITLEEHLEQYNRLIASECKDDSLGWRPHEHI